jgi:hypothetical protein
MAIDKTPAAGAKALESLDAGKARLAGAVASAVSLAATVGMSIWMIRLLGGPVAGAELARNLWPVLAFAAIGLVAGAALAIARHVGAQQFLLGYWLAVVIAAIGSVLAASLWKMPSDLAGLFGLDAQSAGKWLALGSLAMLMLGAIIVVLLAAASQPHSRQRYASMVIVSISFAVAAVLAVNMLAGKKPVHRSLETLGRYGLSERTKKVLKDVTVPIRLSCVYTSTDKAKGTDEKRTRVLELLEDMKLYCDKVTVDNVTNDSDKAGLLARLRGQLGTQADAHRKFVQKFQADAEALQAELEKEAKTWKAYSGDSYLDQWGLPEEVSSALDDGAAKLKQTRQKVDAALGGAGLPDYADLVRQIKEADEGCRGVIEQSETFVKSLGKIAKAASDPNTQRGLLAQVNKFSDSAAATSDAINSPGADPNDPAAVLAKYAKAASAAADEAAALAKAITNIAGPEQAQLVRQNSNLVLPMGSVSIPLTTYIQQFLAASFRKMAEQADAVVKNTKADYQKKFIAQLRPDTQSLVASANEIGKMAGSAVKKLGEVDKVTSQAFAAAEAGKLFAGAAGRIKETLAAADKLPALKDTSLSTDITGENIIIVEAGPDKEQKVKVISFNEVWPLKVRPMGMEPQDQGPQARQFNGDGAIGSRILEMTSQPFALVLLTYWGPGPDMPPQMAEMMPRSELPPEAFAALRERLQAANFAVEDWDLNKDMPDPNDHKGRQKVLIVLPPAPAAQQNPFQPQQAPMPQFGPENAKKVTDAIAGGVPAVFLATFSPPRQISPFMPPASAPYAWGQYLRDQWGMDVKTDYLVVPAVTDEKTPGKYKVDAERFNYLPLSSFTDQPIGKPLQGQRVMWTNLCPILGKLTTRGEPAPPPAGVTFQPVLRFPGADKATWATRRIQDLLAQFRTSEGSYISPDYEAGDIPVPFDLAVAATKAEDKEKGIKPVRIVVMTVGASLSSGYMDQEVPVRDAKGTLSLADPPRTNADLPINSIYWLIGRQGLISSGPIQATMREIPPTLYNALVVAYCVVLPMLIVGLGLLVMYRRSR